MKVAAAATTAVASVEAAAGECQQHKQKQGGRVVSLEPLTATK